MVRQPKEMTLIFMIQELLTGLGINPVTTDDKFDIKYNDRILSVKIRRKHVVETVLLRVGKEGFSNISVFPTECPRSREERDALICELSDAGYSQGIVATQLDVSQTLVSTVLGAREKTMRGISTREERDVTVFRLREMGRTQEEIAEELGISQVTVNNILNNKGKYRFIKSPTKKS